MPEIIDDMAGARLPGFDGELNEYTSKEAARAAGYFDANRRVVFVNGMGNSAEDHVRSAMALSLVQMCPVVAVYNQGGGFVPDLWQCLNDKNQFNGMSFSAVNRVAIDSWMLMVRIGQTVPKGMIDMLVAQQALSRNPPQVTLFNLLRQPEYRTVELFAHSQGNLILSNALQAIAAVDGPDAVRGRIVHTFGSPAFSWPAGIVLRENAYSVDPFAMLAGPDLSFSISKVRAPRGTILPYAHAFLDYMRDDPRFVVNRFRVGGLGLTFALGEQDLAAYLVEMGGNLPRVLTIFRHLEEDYNSDADEVAEHYVELIRRSHASTIGFALRGHRQLVELLIRVMDEGWTTKAEHNQIEYLRGLLG
jgi:hypothetical protein